MGRRRVLGVTGAVAMAVLLGAPWAPSVSARPAPAARSGAAADASATPPPWFQYVEGSSTGVAWSIARFNDLPGGEDEFAATVHYQALGGAQGTVDDASSPFNDLPFRLVAGQLYTQTEHHGQLGVDIADGSPLGTYDPYCTRTRHGCFTIEQVPAGYAYRFSYTPDAGGQPKILPTVPVDGTVQAGDFYYTKAADDRGAVVSGVGSRDTPGATGSTLAYLDFASGTYTVLDATNYAAGDIVAMDDSYVAWTHDGRAVYLARAHLGATPVTATPDDNIYALTLNGDALAYLRDQQPRSDDVYAGDPVVRTGTLGSSAFTSLDGTPTAEVVPLDDGDFGVSAGTTSADFGLYRVAPGSSTLGARVVLFGIAPNLPTLPPDDFNGAGHSSQAVVDGAYRWQISGHATTQLGAPGDIAATTTTSGRVAQPTVFRPSTGTWYQRGESGGLTKTRWGERGDRPVAAHYAGLNAASVLAVYRPSSHRWYVHGQAGVQYGLTGDVPVPGHYYGTAANGHADQIATYRPSTGTWYLRGHPSVRWGAPGDVPAPGDYDGDGRTDVAVYRPSTQDWWVRGRPGPIRWGLPGDVPVTGDFNGDGTIDLAVYRPSTHTWWVRGVGKIALGAAGDALVGRAPFSS